MRQEADRLHIEEHNRVGGVIFDEMSIQSDLVAVHRVGRSSFSGLPDLGPHGNGLAMQRKGK